MSVRRAVSWPAFRIGTTPNAICVTSSLKTSPLGSRDETVDDADADWQIVIFEHRGFVYVMEGAAPKTQSFDVWFRVPRDRYIAEWARVISEFNPIAPLA